MFTTSLLTKKLYHLIDTILLYHFIDTISIEKNRPKNCDIFGKRQIIHLVILVCLCETLKDTKKLVVFRGQIIMEQSMHDVRRTYWQDIVNQLHYD